MKIVMLSTDFKPRPGGVAELSHQLARGLAGLGHPVVVATDQRHEDGWRDESQPYIVRRVMAAPRRGSRRNPLVLVRHLRWMSSSRRALRRLLLVEAPDVVIACNYHSLWADVLRQPKLPFVQFVVGEDVAGALRPGRLLARRRMIRTLIRASRVIAISDYSRRLVLRLAGGFVVPAVIPCGFPARMIQPLDAAIGRTGRTVVTVARLESRKGIDTTLHALAALLPRIPGLRYTVVGDGPDRAALQKLARDLGIAERVEFTGHVDDERKRAIYLASDLYVMPSRPGRSGECEGFGISFLEANAHGLPVIGSTAGGIPDAVEDGVTGLLVPPADPKALAAAMARLLADPEARRRMAAAGQRRIRESLNWDTIAQRVEALIHQVVGR